MTRSSEDLPSTVAFPSSNQDRTSVYSVQSSISTNSSDSQLPPPPPLPYLPFRRISLPSLPPQNLLPQHSPLRRQQTQPQQPQRSSIASFDSLPETEESEGREIGPMGRILRNKVSTASASGNSPHVTPRKGPRRTAMSMQIGSRPPSLSPMRRRSQGIAALPLNDPLLVKRRKVVMEFYETEKAYVEGLDLIYEHFLLPILNSLETSTPILERPLLTSVFSNFIDVWNFHRSLYSELSRLFYPPIPLGMEQRYANTPPPSAVTPQHEQLPDMSSAFPLSPPPLSPVLLAHFPYLSLYTPFITAFPQTLTALNTLLTPSYYYQQQPRAQTRAAAARAQSSQSPSTASPTKGTELKYEKRFADFVATQEKDPRCGRLKLRDWLLTIVQRCPRYLLLLGDLLSCTPGEAEGVEQIREKIERDKKKWYREATKEEEKEREKLIQVYGLVSKITTSLNTSISSHSQTLSLLALQRSTANLPSDEFQFISPGRTLLRRGALLQIENSDDRVRRGESKDSDMRPREREFLLFSDCLVWLASEEAERKEKEWNFDLGSIWTSFSGGGGSGTSTPVQSESGERPKSAALAKSTPLIVEERVDNGSDDNVVSASAVPRDLKRPPMARTRSKSEAEVTLLQAKAAVASTSNDVLDSPNILAKSKSALPTDKNARRPVHKSNFSRINKSSALHLHFRDRRGRKDSSSRPYGGWEKEQWLFKGKIDLVNLEIVIDTSVGIEEEGEEGDGELEWRWEVLSPQGSFVLYAVSAQDRADWTTLIRQAKSQQLVALNAQHPNSTLTSSEATQHIRRTLQALPFAPNDVRMQEVGLDKVLSRLSTGSGNGASVEEHHEGKGKGRDTKSHKKSSSKDKKASNPVWHKERRSRVEHWVPAIWIPDEKAEGCMRCGKTFGWRRRRHHCRLCGRCVCSSCSEKTFYIADPNTKDDAASKPARACNACYESVFPLIDPHPDPGDPTDAGDSTIRARPHPPPLPHSSFSDPTSSSFLPQSTSAMSYVSNADTITSLSHLPSWMNMSVPALALSSTSSATGVDARSRSTDKSISGPAALMAIDSKRYSYGPDERRRSSGNIGNDRLSRDSGVVFDLDSSADEFAVEDLVQSSRSGSRVKLRSSSSSANRPRSYHEILEDFNSAGNGNATQTPNRIHAASPLEEMAEYGTDDDGEAAVAYGDGEDSSALSSSSVTSSKRHTMINLSTSSSSVSLSTSPPTSSRALPLRGKGPLSGVLVAERKEDTARRNKRFSMPAVALQTTSVVARTQSILPQSAGRGKSVAFAESSTSPGSVEESKRVAAGRLGSGGLLPGMPGTRSKRFSLVLGGRHGHSPHSNSGDRDGHASPTIRRIGRNGGHAPQGMDLGKGVAASKLNELLGRSKQG